MIILYQFKCSHYCEKAAWALDYKGIKYTVRNMIAGPHVLTIRKLASDSIVPVIVDGENIVQGSDMIVTYLDKQYPSNPLLPEDAEQSAEVMEWEDCLDREFGIPLRLFFYFHALPDRKLTTAFLLQGTPWYGHVLYAVMFRILRQRMIKLMVINADTARQAQTQLQNTIDRLNDRLKDRKYLVGDCFTRADLTACAFLAPLLNGWSGMDLPSPVQ